MPTAVVERDFSEFYRLEFGRVAGAVRVLAGSAAEDVTQEAFMVALSRWDEVGSLDIPYAWVRRVAMRIAGRRAERERRRAVLESSALRPDSPRPPELDLVAALADLPDRHAAAVWLHHAEDRPVSEVADRLGCSVGAAKVLLLRSRRQLAERVGGLSGRWTSYRRWTPDGIVAHLTAIGAGEHTAPVIDVDLGGRGGRWELTIGHGVYRLYRDDGMRLDDGRCNERPGLVELVPWSATGHVLLRVAIDGDRMWLGALENTTPPTLDVPDTVWTSLFLESGAFLYGGRPQPPA